MGPLEIEWELLVKRCIVNRIIFPFIIIPLLSIIGCVSPGISMHDLGIFSESPKIVTHDGRYFLRFRYGNDERVFYFITWSNIKNEKLIFYVPATSSSGDPRGRVQFEEIADKGKIDYIRRGEVYWEEPSGDLIPLKIDSMKESIESLPSRLRTH